MVSDSEKAVTVCEKAAEGAHPNFQAVVGTLYLNGKGGFPQDYGRAMTWFERAAKEDQPDGQYYLGMLYHFGLGVQQDTAQAALWYRKSAGQNHPAAQVALSTLYLEGNGVPRNPLEAAKLAHRAADQGYADGQYGIGISYAIAGNGVPQDYLLAHMWLNLAAAQGHEQAKTFLPEVAKLMTPEQIAEAQRLAREWKPNRPPQDANPLESVGPAPHQETALTVPRLRLSNGYLMFDCIGEVTLNSSSIEFFPTQGRCAVEMNLRWADVRSLQFHYSDPVYSILPETASLWVQTDGWTYEVRGIPAAITRIRRYCEETVSHIPQPCTRFQDLPCDGPPAYPPIQARSPEPSLPIELRVKHRHFWGGYRNAALVLSQDSIEFKHFHDHGHDFRTTPDNVLELSRSWDVTGNPTYVLVFKKKTKAGAKLSIEIEGVQLESLIWFLQKHSPKTVVRR